MEINNTLCMSVKSRTENVQCPHKKKEGTDYCGRHLRSNNIVRIESFIVTTPVVEQSVEQPVIKKPVKKQSSKTGDEIYYCCTIKSSCNQQRLQNSCEYYGIQFQEDNVKECFKELRKYLRGLDKKYGSMIKQLFMIQKTIRGWNIRKRNISNNKEDCGTMDSIYEIPLKYFTLYNDDDGFTYSFDVRTLDIILKSDKPVNPYSQKPFNLLSDSGKLIVQKINDLQEKNEVLKYDSPKLTDEQRYQQFVVRVFQKMDMLGQYTDVQWFNNMELMQLKKFYRSANDMFEYRAQLSHEVKKKITKDGHMFRGLIDSVHLFREKNKRVLQSEILKEMERIVDEGEDKEYKTLGVNLLLTVLTEYSPEAALALPHLVQSSFG